MRLQQCGAQTNVIGSLMLRSMGDSPSPSAWRSASASRSIRSSFSCFWRIKRQVKKIVTVAVGAKRTKASPANDEHRCHLTSALILPDLSALRFRFSCSSASCKAIHTEVTHSFSFQQSPDFSYAPFQTRQQPS